MNQCFTYSISPSISFFAEIHTFSAKEKDTETGYSYFGSRYYSSDLSIWLSVDPMSDKYPHQSNYVYCSNNPIRITDPNGEDEYEFDGSGNMTRVKESNNDIFYKIDENGTRTGESLSFKGKIVSDQKTIEGEKRNSFYLRIDNANDAEAVFSFISDKVEQDGGEYSNSIVQDKGGAIYNLIGSDIDAVKGESYSITNLLYSNEYSVMESIHNHYAGKVSPSESDVKLARQFPNTNFMVRTLGNYCTPYDGNTPADYDMGTSSVSVPLKPFEIIKSRP
ncbi:MAG: hypothetical protein MJZ52_03860 [Bacteroidales bacterium]|nr:hypothetical protein [Bacteroidales bacterium]